MQLLTSVSHVCNSILLKLQKGSILRENRTYFFELVMSMRAVYVLQNIPTYRFYVSELIQAEGCQPEELWPGKETKY